MFWIQLAAIAPYPSGIWRTEACVMKKHHVWNRVKMYHLGSLFPLFSLCLPPFDSFCYAIKVSHEFYFNDLALENVLLFVLMKWFVDIEAFLARSVQGAVTTGNVTWLWVDISKRNLLMGRQQHCHGYAEREWVAMAMLQIFVVTLVRAQLGIGSLVLHPFSLLKLKI